MVINVHRAKALYRLQQIDLQIARNEKQLSALRAQLTEPETLSTTKEALTSLRQQLRHSETELTDAELTTQGLEAKIKQIESALYSGRVTNPKEIASQQANVLSMKKHLSALEDRQLDLMMQYEQLEGQEQELQHTLKTEESRWHQILSQLLAEIEQVEQVLAKLQSDRQALVDSIATADLQLYEHLRARKGGIAVARLEDHRCSVCGISVPESIQQAVMYGGDLAYCGSCGRILSPS